MEIAIQNSFMCSLKSDGNNNSSVYERMTYGSYFTSNGHGGARVFFRSCFNVSPIHLQDTCSNIYLSHDFASGE